MTFVMNLATPNRKHCSGPLTRYQVDGDLQLALSQQEWQIQSGENKHILQGCGTYIVTHDFVFKFQDEPLLISSTGEVLMLDQRLRH